MVFATLGYREVVERDDIDAVIVSTPDHWNATMAIAAMRAGKAVYCEKPLALTIEEGQEIVKTVLDTGATFQHGTQQRSWGKFRTACQLVRAGRIGQLHKVTISLLDLGTRLPPGPFAVAPIPKGLNWDFWCGPAPYSDYSPERHRNWHYWWETGGGEITNFVHHIDIAHLAMDMDDSGPVSVEARAELPNPNTPNSYTVPMNFTVDMRYPNDVH
jgi:hypothetical protein